MTRTPRTQPLPAPAGYHWAITDTLSVDLLTDEPLLQLGLWPEGVWPACRGQSFGLPLRKAIPNFAKGCRLPIFPVASGTFTREKQLRRTSRRVLRVFERNQACKQLTERLLNTLND